MTTTTTLDLKAVDKAIAAIKASDGLIAPEFEVSGHDTIKAIVKDYRGGVASISGDLKAGIVGELTRVAGVNVDGAIMQTAEHGGYNYGARLDKDGRMRWKSGKFSGYRTFGWWLLVWNKLARKYSKREFSKGLNRAVNKIMGKLP